MSEIEEIREHLDVICSTTLEISFRIDLEKCLSHISTLEKRVKEWRENWDLELAHSQHAEARVKELESEKSYWNCPTHGKSQNAWGCPECVRELRELRERGKELESDLKLNASMLAKQCDLARDAESRLKRLQEAIEKHKKTDRWDLMDYINADEELYKVLEEVEG